MSYFVVELGESGKPHLHGLICTEKGFDKTDLQGRIWRDYVRDFVDKDNIPGVACRLDVNYDDRWINEYLSKEAGVRVVQNLYNAEREHEFYPTPEQTLVLQIYRDASEAADSFYSEHSAFYKIWLGEQPGNRYAVVEHVSTAKLAGKYFEWRMYVKKNMSVIIDTRRLHQMARALDKYTREDCEPDFEDRKYYASLRGPVLDFSG